MKGAMVLLINHHSPHTMPNCGNCGSFVTAQYARVFTPNDVEQPRVCPNCEDIIRDGSDVREARSQRRSVQQDYQDNDRSEDANDD